MSLLQQKPPELSLLKTIFIEHISCQVYYPAISRWKDALKLLGVIVVMMAVACSVELASEIKKLELHYWETIHPLVERAVLEGGTSLALVWSDTYEGLHRWV